LEQARLNLIQSWIHKANHDLGAAELILRESSEYTDTICFHCQQAVEKGLKAYLTFLDIDFQRTHSLDYLVTLIQTRVEFPLELYELLEGLEDYAVDVRYPTGWADPSILDAEEAFNSARQILAYLVLKIKKDAY